MRRTVASSTLARVLAASLLSVLAACGGGGGDDAVDVRITQQAARTASQSVVVPSDGAQAMSVTMSAASFVVGRDGASVDIACEAGGRARYEIGGLSGGFGNGRFDAGEEYSITFTGCRSNDGSVIDGELSFEVDTSSGQNYTATATHDLTVQLPQRTTHLYGTSNFDHREVVAGSDKTVTDHWTATRIGIDVTDGSRSRSFSLGNVDLTRVVTTTNGSVTSRKTSGTCTLKAVVDGVSLNFVWRSDGDVRFDIDGLPTDGAWSLLLPGNVIGLKVKDVFLLGRVLEIKVDWFGDGSIDIPVFFIDVDDLP